MPQSLSNTLLHIVFSTKGRARTISAETASDLYPYLASISAAHGCPPHRIGGTEDHVHICCSLARTQKGVHHTRVSFQDELRELLRRYGIPYDERYVWD